MINNMNRWVLALQVLALALLAPVEADAACMWAPPSGELFTVPADGAMDVPTDARLWVLVGMEATVTVVMDGVVLSETKEGRAWRSYELPTLEAGKAYSYLVTICHAEGCPEPFEYGPYKFTVGGEVAAVPVAPELVEMTAEPTDGNWNGETGSEPCERQIMAQDCYDVGPIALYELTLKSNPEASHFAVWTGDKKAGNLYFCTADCPVQIISMCPALEDSDDCDLAAHVCFNVAAYNEAGEAMQPVEMCRKPVAVEPQGDDTGVADVAGDVGAENAGEASGEPGAGCAVSAGRSAVAGWLLLAIFAVLALLGRRKAGKKTLTLALLSLVLMVVASCDSSRSESATDAMVNSESRQDTAPAGDCKGVFDSEQPPEVIAALRVCVSSMAGFPWNFPRLHGSTAAYLYSDGFLVYRDPDEQESGPTLLFRKTMVGNEQYCALLTEFSLAGLEQEAGSGWLALTEATDLPDTEVFLRSGGEEVQVSVYGDLFDLEEWYMAEDYESVAPNAIALARGLKKLSTGGEFVESESIQIVAAILTDDYDSQNCPMTGAVEWPFADIPLADHAYEWESAGGVGLTLAGQQAKEVRDWWVAEVESPPCTRVFADIEGNAYEVFLAEVPPGGPEAMPFLPCPGLTLSHFSFGIDCDLLPGDGSREVDDESDGTMHDGAVGE